MKGKKLKGSALLWAICTLLIFMVIVTGIVSLNQQYVNEEINSYSEKKAEYIARSGIDIIVSEIENGKLDEYLKDTSEFNIILEMEEGVSCDITVQNGDKLITLVSKSQNGVSKETVCARLKRSRGKWEFIGYFIY